MILCELISCDVLRVMWWLMSGVVPSGFALTDGFDMGVGVLLTPAYKTDSAEIGPGDTPAGDTL